MPEVSEAVKEARKKILDLVGEDYPLLAAILDLEEAVREEAREGWIMQEDC